MDPVPRILSLVTGKFKVTVDICKAPSYQMEDIMTQTGSHLPF